MGAGHAAYLPRELVMTMVDQELEALKSGDENVFEDLTRRHYPAMLRIAMAYVRDREVADDLVQEAWLTFLRTLDRFEGRSSLRTWLFGILTNLARARRRRESRFIPFTSLLEARAGWRGATVDQRRFGADDRWQSPPSGWSQLPETVIESQETLAQVRAAIDMLPPKLREVIVLRDVVGLSGDEVGDLLAISSSNQRVRLHRARAAVRQKLEDVLR
jgi:RNA polymerase sigma-70 factor (ECF subfamily)